MELHGLYTWTINQFLSEMQVVHHNSLQVLEFLSQPETEHMLNTTCSNEAPESNDLEPQNVSQMRSKGSRFTLGVWGLRVCSLDVAFVVATVRNRSRELRMAVPMGSFAEVVLFGGFRLSGCFVSRGRRGTS